MSNLDQKSERRVTQSGTIAEKQENDMDEETEVEIDELCYEGEDLFRARTSNIDTDSPSYRCLKELSFEGSSTMNNPLYFFPPMEDPGIDDAFNYVVYKSLCAGLTGNHSLKSLNLSWNSISLVGVSSLLSKYLRSTTTLKFLDLSNNMLKGKPLNRIRLGVSKSLSLEHLKIGNNVFDADEAYLFAKFMSKPGDHQFNLLDMENMSVNKDFLTLLKKIRAQGRDVIGGHVLQNYEIRGPNITKVFFDRCRYLAMKPKRKKRKKDFGHFILSLPSLSLTRNNFEDLIKKIKLKTLDNILIIGLEDQYIIKRGDTLNTKQMMDDYMQFYPDTKLPVAVPRKAKKSKKGRKSKKKKRKGKSMMEEPEGKDIVIEATTPGTEDECLSKQVREDPVVLSEKSSLIKTSQTYKKSSAIGFVANEPVNEFVRNEGSIQLENTAETKIDSTLLSRKSSIIKSNNLTDKKLSAMEASNNEAHEESVMNNGDLHVASKTEFPEMENRPTAITEKSSMIEQYDTYVTDKNSLKGISASEPPTEFVVEST